MPTKPGLTDTAIRQAKPEPRPYNRYDTLGLYLTIAPTGAKWWRLKYRFGGKECRIGLGAYPEVSLKEARDRRDNARTLLRDGRDPGAERRAARSRARTSVANTFQAVAELWLEEQRPRLAETTIAKNRWLLQQVMPELGPRPIADIRAPDVLSALARARARGRYDTARRARQCISQVFAFATEYHLAEFNPAAELRRTVQAPKPRSRAAITTPVEIGKLLRAIEGYTGQPTTRAALRIAPLVFVRPGELRQAEWQELDLDAAEWRIPAHKTKMRDEHIVPLSRQAVAIFLALHQLTGNGRFCFPSLRSANRPMSENTLNAALRGLGFDKDTMTAHGFRAMASTRLNELGWSPDVIELQLAHTERNKVRAAYNRAQHLADRRRMMQTWADYLDGLALDARLPT
jgi:integrase